MYASQGYAAVTTDYEGMRDPGRIHHYMVGELEGRALLDAVRALRNLPETRGRLNGQVFLSGYSQGGHAAFWADKIAAAYAPDIKPTGVLGYGPVMSVKQTLLDVTHAANINWFGPYVLYSYRDYYKTDYGQLLLQHWDDTLNVDVPSHCIDTDIPFWGHNPANVYSPEFMAAMAGGTMAETYPAFNRDLLLNEVAPTTTSTPKRINQGEHDNVVLASQQQAVMPALCQSSQGPVQLVVYPNTTHYDTMLHSLPDTLAWMRALSAGQPQPTSCGR
jgi:acetyl esterase/lipase